MVNDTAPPSTERYAAVQLACKHAPRRRAARQRVPRVLPRSEQLRGGLRLAFEGARDRYLLRDLQGEGAVLTLLAMCRFIVRNSQRRRCVEPESEVIVVEKF